MNEREIKFRAWDGVTLYYFTLNDIDAGSIRTNYSPLETPPNFGFVPLNKMIVMQYTGLKDKNGNEIYEGDIIEYCNYGENYKGTIKFEDGSYYILDVSDNELYYLNNCSEIEVVFNIYETPNFLKTDEK